MSLKDLRAIKREWLQNTVSYVKLRKIYKLDKEDILQIKSEIKYGEERFYLKDIKEYLDEKIANNLNQQTSIPTSMSGNTKRCEQCKNDVNKDYFSHVKPTICIPCERKNENRYNKKLEQIETSRRIKPSGKQITI